MTAQQCDVTIIIFIEIYHARELGLAWNREIPLNSYEICVTAIKLEALKVGLEL